MNANSGVTMVLLALAACAGLVYGQEPAKDRGAAPAVGDLEARRLLDRGLEMIDSGEREHGVKMIATVLEQYPLSRVVYPASLALAKHYIQANQHTEALTYLGRLRALEPADGLAQGEDRDLFLEGMYLTGMANFQLRQYGKAFPVLRHITSKYPNTVWANQAYYYIGMCHFVQQNWNQAIEALSLVGTFVDPKSPTTAFAEGGRRFYVKVEDADFPILMALGKKISVKVSTSGGDVETVDCVALTGDTLILIGSIPTDIGVAKPGDRVLQVTGGAEITTTYVDESTESGAANVERTAKVRVVSTGTVDFMLGDFETRAVAAFQGQPLFVRLFDADLDTSDQAESVTVTVISRYKYRPPDEDVNESAFVDESKLRYQTRDRVEVRLTEQPPAVATAAPVPVGTTGAVVAVAAAAPAPAAGTGAVRTGRFTGKVEVMAGQEGRPADQSDDVLTCQMDDEVVVTYTDVMHIGGASSRTVDAQVSVVGEVAGGLSAPVANVADVSLRASKDLVEASAYLELARIFRSMGLLSGAKDRAAEGLVRVERVIRTEGRDASLAGKQEEAFRLKWELHIEAGQLQEALATCSMFSQMFPNSPLVDQALMGMANIRVENKEYEEALSIYKQITMLKNSEAKAEAQFRIAKTIEEQPLPPGRTQAAEEAQLSRAVQEYKMCVDRYPTSPFAGEAIQKVVEFNIKKGDYSQANALLEQTFQEYPDEEFLDKMLLMWGLMAYQTGDLPKAREKLQKLLFDYPESAHAATAKERLKQIDDQLGGSAGGNVPAK
jgi:outer membrane protein assembly factor BamD (BamD/ComL family)